MAYSAYVLTETGREHLLAKLPPHFEKVIAHHVTVEFGVPESSEPPVEAEVRVVGYTSDQYSEVAVVEVNGNTHRKDGGVYHITLSLSPAFRKPKDSNDLLKKGWVQIPSFIVEVEPKIVEFNREISIG